MTDKVYVICVTAGVIGVVRATLSISDISLLLYTLIIIVLKSSMKSEIKSQIKLKL